MTAPVPPLDPSTSSMPSMSSIISAALDKATRHLVSLVNPDGFWEGHLSSSALSTATALSALAPARFPADRPLIERGLAWLANTQNPDGGWGDTPDSPSNLSTTILAICALTIAGSADALVRQNPGTADGLVRSTPPPADPPSHHQPFSSPLGPLGPFPPFSDTCARADAYLTTHAGATVPERVAAIRAIYGEDRTFATPILMNCALAGLVPWSAVPPLPFELALCPRALYRALRLHVVSYALPALIAVGALIHSRNPTKNPIFKTLRNAALRPVLSKLSSLQPASGGFLEATPLTSFVGMSLVALVGPEHPVAAQCLAFLRASARPDGSWPIDSNLSVWVTTGALAALAHAGALGLIDSGRTRAWIAARQWRHVHPFTGAAPGGFAWTHLSGGVPDADDTAGAILGARASSPAPPPDCIVGHEPSQWVLPVIRVTPQFDGRINAARIWAFANLRSEPVPNRATGMKIRIGRRGILKATSQKAASHGVLKVHLDAFTRLRELIHHAVLAESYPDRENDPNLKAIHHFYSAMEIEGRIYRVKLTVKEYVHELPGYYTHEISKLTMPAGTHLAAASEDLITKSQAGKVDAETSTISIARLLNGVKKFDGKTFVPPGSGAPPSGDVSPLGDAGLRDSLSAALDWLLDLQNSDGGWPTFCRGWGKLPFDRSAPDLTAHVLRALLGAPPSPRTLRAVRRGFRYLEKSQRSDGSWIPLWFGNQLAPRHENPVLGTARVLLAWAAHAPHAPAVRRGIDYLLGTQNPDGGWGGAPAVPSTVEETALALAALARFDLDPPAKESLARGVHYLVGRVQDGSWLAPAPIGLYFASLWYSEALYPAIWTVEALAALAARDLRRVRGT